MPATRATSRTASAVSSTTCRAPCSGWPSAASRESHIPGGQGDCAARAETCGSSCAARDCPRSSGTSRFSSYYTTTELQRLVTPELGAALGDYDPLARHRAYLDATAGLDELSRLLYLDHKTFLPCLNLTYTDKMSMAASVEVRVPLLDDELVALAARIPSSLKLHGTRRKYVFKKSQERVLPRNIVWRRKAGFGAPVRAWLSGDLAPMIADLLSEETVSRRGLVDPGAVRRLIDDNASGHADTSLQLYALLTLELWHQTFVDRPWTFDRLAADSLIAA